MDVNDGLGRLCVSGGTEYLLCPEKNERAGHQQTCGGAVLPNMQLEQNHSLLARLEGERRLLIDLPPADKRNGGYKRTTRRFSCGGAMFVVAIVGTPGVTEM
jgi:hypothetical protein